MSLLPRNLLADSHRNELLDAPDNTTDPEPTQPQKSDCFIYYIALRKLQHSDKVRNNTKRCMTILCSIPKKKKKSISEENYIHVVS